MAKGYNKTHKVMPTVMKSPQISDDNGNNYPNQNNYSPTELPEIPKQQVTVGSIIDSNDALVRLNLSKESAPELNSRLKIQEDEAKFKRIITSVLIGIVIIVTIAALVYCAYIISDEKTISENRTQAWALISLIVGGFLGFLTGRSIK